MKMSKFDLAIVLVWYEKCQKNCDKCLPFMKKYCTDVRRKISKILELEKR